ncbi:ATP-dependent RNA helicase dbp6 [Coemansia sp. RSA 1824]|nr:ATP-dependent RNA helicase dbp6 [Coemansia sp. RSA 1824]
MAATETIKKDKASRRADKTDAKKRRESVGEDGVESKHDKAKKTKHEEIIEKKNKHAKRPHDVEEVAAKEASETEAAAEALADGLERFPDFSQEHALSQEMALKAAKMGIPGWLAHPTMVDRDSTAAINDSRFGLSAHMLGRCEKAGVDAMFAVQAAVIPVLRAAQALTRLRQHVRDVCVSAPTGSGKTLAFVIPIVERLRRRVEVRLRALVVLPTKELARQVREAFQFFCTGTDLRVGLAIGDVSLSKEQAALVSTSGSSRVDILVCTPGRLVDHIAQTHGFTLQHVEYWVMDEADRLLGDANHEWLARVQAAIEAPVRRGNYGSDDKARDGITGTDSWSRSKYPGADILGRPAPRIQKLLFSATLTQDPAQLARLRLERPLYIAVAATDSAAPFAFPSTLEEFYAACPVDEKPLWLIWLLWQQQLRGAVCFAKSLEAAHRLAQVVQSWAAQVPDYAWPGARLVVAEYSSDLPSTERARIMREFRAGTIGLLVCSDLIARGLDIDQVSAVINYDVPTHMSQYTHRVGRTARAGRRGAAYTLVAAPQMFHFKKMMKDHDHWAGFLAALTPRRDVLDLLRPQYAAALESVDHIYA